MEGEGVAGALHVHARRVQRSGDGAGRRAGDAGDAQHPFALQFLHRLERGDEVRDLRASALNGQLDGNGHDENEGTGMRRPPLPLRGPYPP